MVLPLRSALIVFAACGLLLGAGCTTHRPPDELAQAVAMGEKPVAMKGEGLFFGQRLKVTVTVSRGIGRGGAMGGGGKRGGGGGGKRGAEMPDITGMDNDEAMAYLRAKSAVGSPMPPVTLHLRIENVSGQTFSVDVLDFNSDLGNFAIHPETLAVAPAQVAEPDPMVSQMGVSADVIPFQVTLKLDGKRETQTIEVRNIMVPQGK